MQKGTVIKSTGSWYNVRLDDGNIIECRIRGRFRFRGLTDIRLTNPVAVGDIVTIDKNKDSAVIVAIDDRKNHIIRRSTNLSKEAHILASNIDQTLLIATINHPKTSTVFIDRL